MRCVVAGGALEQASRFLAAATSGARSTLPILSHILLDAREDNTLRMASTNLTLWLEWTIFAEVEEPGQIAVAGKEWRSLVVGLTSNVELDAPSELEMAGRMTVKFDGGEYKLPVLPAEEFPVPPEEVKMREPIQIIGHKLAEALKKVMFAASSDLTMGIFTGIHFRKEAGDDFLDIVATDTHRLALFRL
ncbi:MAG: DNA polymerase III subunit beta, partial [Armatimonadota bacterium]|nr:DNA polymerase III subunit beta [Armatimonadota bacterium]